MRRGLRQLLVDEFQDTDRVQCDLVGYLAMGDDGRRPGLFLVGDPKQSIYGWRNADLAAYEAFVGQVREAGGQVHALVVNHRSAPPVLDEVARLVGPVMEETPGLQPRFEPLLPSPANAEAPGFADGERAPVEHWVSWSFDAGGTPEETRTAAGEVCVISITPCDGVGKRNVRSRGSWASCSRSTMTCPSASAGTRYTTVAR